MATSFIGIVLLGVFAYMVFFYFRLKRANKRAEREPTLGDIMDGKTKHSPRPPQITPAVHAPAATNKRPDTGELKSLGKLAIYAIILIHCFLWLRYSAITPCGAAADRLIEEHMAKYPKEPTDNQWQALGQNIGRGYSEGVLWSHTYARTHEENIFHCYAIAFGWSNWKPKILTARD